METLRLWIDQGAEWQSHWAFIPPERPALPPVADSEWPRNQIDNFVGARLEQEGRTPSPEADLLTSIRRVTLDLTGLPPTQAEIAAVLSDDSPDAYENLVERVLQSSGGSSHKCVHDSAPAGRPRRGKRVRMRSCQLTSGEVVCRSVDGRLRGPRF